MTNNQIAEIKALMIDLVETYGKTNQRLTLMNGTKVIMERDIRDSHIRVQLTDGTTYHAQTYCGPFLVWNVVKDLYPAKWI